VVGVPSLLRSLGLGVALSGLIQVALCAQQIGPGNTAIPHSAPISATRSAKNPAGEQRSVSAPRQEDPDASPRFGEDPENRLIIPFVKHLAGDQQTFGTAPARFRVQDLKWAAPFVGVTAGFIASDSWISKQIPLGKVQTSKTFSDYGAYSFIAAGGGAFLLGHLTGDDHMSEAGLLSGEAAINSTAIAYLLKSATQRARPYQANGSGTFFQGGGSFPSEHAAIAWSIATVMAHEYPGTLTKILAYGLATGISATRVTGQQHFASDVFVGSALGWYFGRQVYRSHHDAHLAGDGWDDVVPESSGNKERDPASMGSPYVPLDSWVYPALERLIALGYIKSGYLGMRPWTRLECARMLDEAEQNIADQDDSSAAAWGIYRDLARELSVETSRLNGASNLGASLDSVYARATNISGAPLRDGYHFGQTILNDYGRPYGEGLNAIGGVTGHAEAGPFAFSVRGEYQHAPAVASDPPAVLQAAAAADVTLPTPDGSPVINRFHLVEGSIGFTYRNTRVSFGKQSLWLGPGESGPLLFSDNAESITMLRIDNVSPFHFPLLSTLLGPAKMDFSLGQLSGQTWDYNSPNLVGPSFQPQPFIHENKISFKPTSDLEFGFGVTAVFGGPGLPFTWSEFLRSYYSHRASVARGNPAKRFSGFDISWRVPGLKKWLTVYNDSLVVDEISPIGSTRPLLNPGVYVAQLPKIPRLELRFEGIKNGALPHNFAGGFDYWDARYRSGYTNDGKLIGGWARDAIAGQAWAKYSFSSRTNVQFGYRHEEADRHFIGGGRLNDFSSAVELMVTRNVGVSGSFQYEKWDFPVLRPVPQSDLMSRVQLVFYPNWGVHGGSR